MAPAKKKTATSRQIPGTPSPSRSSPRLRSQSPGSASTKSTPSLRSTASKSPPRSAGNKRSPASSVKGSARKAGSKSPSKHKPKRSYFPLNFVAEPEKKVTLELISSDHVSSWNNRHRKDLASTIRKDPTASEKAEVQDKMVGMIKDLKARANKIVCDQFVKNARKLHVKRPTDSW